MVYGIVLPILKLSKKNNKDRTRRKNEEIIKILTDMPEIGIGATSNTAPRNFRGHRKPSNPTKRCPHPPGAEAGATLLRRSPAWGWPLRARPPRSLRSWNVTRSDLGTELVLEQRSVGCGEPAARPSSSKSLSLGPLKVMFMTNTDQPFKGISWDFVWDMLLMLSWWYKYACQLRSSSHF